MKVGDDIAELLRMMREGRYDEISLKIDKVTGKITMIEALEIITDKKKFEELKREHSHQDITLKQKGFGNERMERRVKKVFK